MQVFYDARERLLSTRLEPELREQRQKTGFARLRAQRGKGDRGLLESQKIEQRRRPCLSCESHRLDILLHVYRAGLRVISLCHSTSLPQQLQNGQIRRRTPIRATPAFEAVAQTQGHCLPLYTGDGLSYGHTDNRALGFQLYDTFRCQDGWVCITAFGGAIYPRVSQFLGLDSGEYSFDVCPRDAVNSVKGQALDRRLRGHCAPHTCLEVKMALSKAQVGCSRIGSAPDQHTDAHY